ncbi:MAG: hypothetical protein EDM74_11125, partial [Armatimonadetes bacterium]
MSLAEPKQGAFCIQEVTLLESYIRLDSGIDSPTIQQRKIKTSVVVDDGATLALGGLIQDQARLNKTQLPVLGDVPLADARVV